MNPERVRWLRTKLSRLFRRRRQEAALDVEMQFHFEQLVAQFRAEGLSAHEAHLAARREFGAADAYREEIRDSWRPPALAEAWRTLRFAARSLARSPGFTLIALVTLGLGVGANTSMFSVVNAIMLRPLPYPASEQLDAIHRATAQQPEGALSPADFLDFVHESDRYGEVAAFAYGDMSVAESGEPPELAPALRVSANFFSLLGIRPQLGRDFRAEEEIHGNHRVLLISHRYWQNRFGADTGVIGRTIRVNGESHVIVGVVSASFNDWRHLGWVDLFRPLGLTDEERIDRFNPILRLLGRRKAGLSPAEGNEIVGAFGRTLATDHSAANADSTWHTTQLNDRLLGATGGVAMGMLIGLSGFVLLIACSNLANFLLARTMARAREFAVRSALGASRLQLLRPLLAESLLLAITGGICAVFVALWAGDWLSTQTTADNGETVTFLLDWRVLSWAFIASLLTAVAFGTAPALFAIRLDLNHTLKSGGRGAIGGRGHQRLRHLLIVGQFALAMVLLAGAALFIRGLTELNNRRSGWSSGQLVTGTLLLPAATYPTAENIITFQRLALERLQAVPGVASASFSSALPFFEWSDARKYQVEGQEPAQPGREPATVINGVSPGYFDTVGTRLLAGRAFRDNDTLGAPRVFVINQAMATALFNEASPIGRRLALINGSSPEWGEIVGVVADARLVSPDLHGVPFQLYQPLAQEPRPSHELAVRTAGVDPAMVVDGIREVMTALDPDLPVRQLQPADVTILRANYQLGVLRNMLTAFAVLGLGLAALGIYGVIARTMAQRTGEFGIRLALGAQLRDIIQLVLGSGVKLALAGAGLGLLGALGIAALLAAGFPGMAFQQGPVLTASTLLLVAVALLACYLPARRASRINPVEALRAE